MAEISLTQVLAFGSLLLSAANLIIGFSLLGYILSHNFTSGLARAFAALLASLVIVSGGDVLLLNVSPESRLLWLRVQWVGIALLPAAYHHFSAELLRSTQARSAWRGVVVRSGYLAGLLFIYLGAVTDLVMRRPEVTPWATYFRAGPAFGLFLAYFLVLGVWAFVNLLRARGRCLSSTARRRMTYMALASVAPPLGVFPYLMVAHASAVLSERPNFLLLTTLIGDAWLAMMTIVLGYSVAFHGVIVPDRVVKHSLVQYLLRGPLVGACLLLLMLTVPRVERLLGLPRDTAVIFAVVGAIVLLQLALQVGRPYLERLLFPRERVELGLIRQLEERLLTSPDLEQLLENVLVGVAETLRVRGGFVAGMEDGELVPLASTWPRRRVEDTLRRLDLAELVQQAPQERSVVAQDGMWLLPLRNQRRDATLGVLGVEARGGPPELGPLVAQLLEELVGQAEVALENRRLQRGVFQAVQQIIPEMDSLQRFRSIPLYAGAPADSLEASPLYRQGFEQWVKDALSHYWGGPKLSESPLLKLQVVQQAAEANAGSLPQALRTVLRQAIEGLRPDGQPSLSNPAWILYNILELKFLRGERIKDIARRLAISESDYYRKQRLAVTEVARQLARMEQELAA